MDAMLLRAFACLASLLVVVAQEGQDVDYFSFGPPYDQYNAYSGNRIVPNWHDGGTTKVREHFIRLTEERQGQKAWLFSTNPVPYTSWSLTFKLRVSGAATQLFGDGLALWYTSNQQFNEGNVFAREDMWTGLGIFFDTFQNIDQEHHHKHPYVSALVNDGTMLYDHTQEDPHLADKAGKILPGRHEGGGCAVDFRFQESRDDFSVLNITTAYITYYNKELRIRMRTDGHGWQGNHLSCVSMPDIELPEKGYFAISAATGDLVDNHDVISFDFKPYNGEEEMVAPPTPEEAPVVVTNDNFMKIIQDQDATIKSLKKELQYMRESWEHKMSGVTDSVQLNRQKVDERDAKITGLEETVTRHVQELPERLTQDVQDQLMQAHEIVDKKIEEVQQNAGFGWSFWGLLVLILVVAAIGYAKYQKLAKTHFL